MKTQFLLEYLSCPHEPYHRVTRERVAYLLRAARSRRSRNLDRNSSGYYIKDCNTAILVNAPFNGRVYGESLTC